MPFGNFTLASAVADFGLTMTSQPLFAGVPPVDPGPVIRQTHASYGQLAVGINTQKPTAPMVGAESLGKAPRPDLDATVGDHLQLKAGWSGLMGQGCQAASQEVGRHTGGMDKHVHPDDLFLGRRSARVQRRWRAAGLR